MVHLFSFVKWPPPKCALSKYQKPANLSQILTLCHPMAPVHHFELAPLPWEWGGVQPVSSLFPPRTPLTTIPRWISTPLQPAKRQMDGSRFLPPEANNGRDGLPGSIFLVEKNDVFCITGIVGAFCWPCNSPSAPPGTTEYKLHRLCWGKKTTRITIFAGACQEEVCTNATPRFDTCLSIPSDWETLGKDSSNGEKN